MEKIIQILHKANGLVFKAKLEERNGMYALSFQFYNESVEAYHEAVKYCTGDFECFKPLLRDTMEKYVKRCIEIEEFLPSRTNSGLTSSRLTAEDLYDLQGRGTQFEGTQSLENPTSSRSSQSEYTVRRLAIDCFGLNRSRDNKINNTSVDCDANQYHAEFEKLIRLPKPGTNFDGVIGLDAVKNLMYDTIMHTTKYGHIIKELGIEKSNRNMLLFGLPGCGKTHLAHCFAAEAAPYSFIEVSGSQLLSKWIGVTESRLKALFEVVQQHSPSILLIDEIDGLLGQKGDTCNGSTIVNEFLIQIEKTINVIVIGCTNVPWNLEPAVKRRFGYIIYVPLPILADRVELLKHLFEDKLALPENASFTQIASKLKGYSSSDIKRVVEFAKTVPWMKLKYADHFTWIDNPQLDTGRPKLMIPCSSTEPVCVQHTYTDFRVECLAIPKLSYDDVVFAIDQIKPTIDVTDTNKNGCVHKTQEFRTKFAHDPTKGAMLLRKKL